LRADFRAMVSATRGNKVAVPNPKQACLRFLFDCARRDAVTLWRGLRMTTMLEIVTLGFGLFSSCLFLAHAYDSYQDVAARPRSQ
jgi:hypothetical protein